MQSRWSHRWSHRYVQLYNAAAPQPTSQHSYAVGVQDRSTAILLVWNFLVFGMLTAATMERSPKAMLVYLFLSSVPLPRHELNDDEKMAYQT